MKTTQHFVLIGVAVLFLSSHQHTSFTTAAAVTHTTGNSQCPQFTQVQACDEGKDQEEQTCTFELLHDKLSSGKGKYCHCLYLSSLSYRFL